jgi:hypothetical protein
LPHALLGFKRPEQSHNELIAHSLLTNKHSISLFELSALLLSITAICGWINHR